jgi:hypothetical protein
MEQKSCRISYGCPSTVGRQHRQRCVKQIIILLCSVLMLGFYERFSCTKNSRFLMVGAERVVEEIQQSEHFETVKTSEDCTIDVTTGECTNVDTTTTSNDTSPSVQVTQDDDERDPNLQEMTYDVGDGIQTTLVYVEPTIDEMYRSPHGNTNDNHVKKQRVVPQFNGLAGKFINMSNKKCTLYWYVYLYCR